MILHQTQIECFTSYELLPIKIKNKNKLRTFITVALDFYTVHGNTECRLMTGPFYTELKEFPNPIGFLIEKVGVNGG